ncbi:pantoate--beta-alanine ligase [Segetibacter sp. 3557_3]|uniref:pantoate--beta-alanine ligase n=1 Tax=Segetibacter sp. 3557_3 TaxID=2547429 RepID=UPI001058D528|nr:pantoate--beta-alanine ligase [Segetibacter sp. 3557_3]TDH28857.1 pantoate--beta-alanine ligase [Segetibacter sp. 3557_3]
MIIYRAVADLKRFINKSRADNKTIGFVPTMGALHQGHLSLIELAKQQSDVVISSIFVNPTQFNDPADYKKYPVTLPEDILKLETHRTDVLFLPSVEEIYPAGLEMKQHYDLGDLETVFEGKYRPGHFQGVSQVIEIFLNIVEPHLLFLGQKDFQQCLVIKRLIQILNLPVKVVVAGTEREPSGLAMSSRNLRLNQDEREKASAIYQTLRSIKNNYTDTPIDKLIDYSEKFLLREGFSKVDYVALANAETLEPVTGNDRNVPLVALVAAFIKDVRLIDNMLLTSKENLVHS